jgi:hypothetical protein
LSGLEQLDALIEELEYEKRERDAIAAQLAELEVEVTQPPVSSCYATSRLIHPVTRKMPSNLIAFERKLCSCSQAWLEKQPGVR